MQKILVLTNSQEQDNNALEKAFDIAEPFASEVEVVHFILTTEQQPKPSITDQKAALSIALESTFKDSSKARVTQNQVVVEDDIAQWVFDYCQQKNFDLIIKTGHRSETLFHTPSDWKLIRKLPVTLLFANQHPWKCKQVVLAAVDPTSDDEIHQQLNRAILDWSKNWQQTFDSQLHIVYSIPISNVLIELDAVDTREFQNQHQAEAEKKLTQLLEKFDCLNYQAHITVGPPEKTIPHLANELKAELVIMGSMGRQGLKGLLVGNVAEKVLHNLRTDSLIVENTFRE